MALTPAPSAETYARYDEWRTCVPARPVGAEINLGAPAISRMSASSLRAGSMFTSALLSYLQRSTDPVTWQQPARPSAQHALWKVAWLRRGSPRHRVRSTANTCFVPAVYCTRPALDRHIAGVQRRHMAMISGCRRDPSGCCWSTRELQTRISWKVNCWRLHIAVISHRPTWCAVHRLQAIDARVCTCCLLCGVSSVCWAAPSAR